MYNAVLSFTTATVVVAVVVVVVVVVVVIKKTNNKKRQKRCKCLPVVSKNFALDDCRQIITSTGAACCTETQTLGIKVVKSR